jgi:hypothetical protein
MEVLPPKSQILNDNLKYHSHIAIELPLPVALAVNSDVAARLPVPGLPAKIQETRVYTSGYQRRQNGAATGELTEALSEEDPFAGVAVDIEGLLFIVLLICFLYFG